MSVYEIRDEIKSYTETDRKPSERMTLLSFAGHVLIIFGPIANVFLTTKIFNAESIVMSMISTFLWFTAIFFSSCFYAILRNFIINPAPFIIIAVFCQELCRLIVFMLVHAFDKLFKQRTNEEISEIACYWTLIKNSFVCGLGFAVASGLFATANILSYQSGPGDIGINGHPTNFMIVSGSTDNMHHSRVLSIS
ncbi:hypothetical protein GJ496_004411 [Pomphorhynchus laevis]|nr:hypothetical protein GJ496_004411 [Pomphorhynchus laevis]